MSDSLSIQKILNDHVKPAERAKVEPLLKALDTDKDGVLTRAEVTAADGMIQCNAATKQLYYPKLGPLQNALFKAGLVDKLRDAVCFDDLSPNSSARTNQIKLLRDVSIGLRSQRWWKRPRYAPDFFDKNPAIYHRTRQNPETERQMMQNIILPGQRLPRTAFQLRLAANQYFTRPTSLPMDFVPAGRIGDELRYEELFFTQAQKALQSLKSLDHILFLNYTGHQGGVGAALADKGIPVYWQLGGNERIINSVYNFQDHFAQNSLAQSSSAAIMLEPNHGGTRIDVSLLPSAQQLRIAKISEVVVFSEGSPREQPYSIDELIATDVNFVKELRSYQKRGIHVRIIGVDARNLSKN